MFKNHSSPKTVLIIASFFYLNNISCQQPAAANQDLRVIILRHAEKPDVGENLSCQGLNRALQLPDVLYNKFKLPDYIYVPSIKTGKGTGVARMYQTIVPFVVKYNLNIDTQFDVGEGAALAQSVLKKTGTVLIIWEHKTIPDIVNALGVNEGKLKWDGGDYDSIWIVSFKNGKVKLNYDKEGLNPAAECK